MGGGAGGKLGKLCREKHLDPGKLTHTHAYARARVNFHGKRIARNDLLAFVLAPREMYS